MVTEEYNNQAGVYKVQTFGTTQLKARLSGAAARFRRKFVFFICLLDKVNFWLFLIRNSLRALRLTEEEIRIVERI